MTVKNPFLQQPIAVPKARIIIEIGPNGSVLKATGNVPIPLVIDTLMAQQRSLWDQWIKEMSKGVVTPSGMPARLTPGPAPEQTPKPNGEGTPTPDDYTFQGDD